MQHSDGETAQRISVPAFPVLHFQRTLLHCSRPIYDRQHATVAVAVTMT